MGGSVYDDGVAEQKEIARLINEITPLYKATQTRFWKTVGLVVAFAGSASFILQLVIGIKDW